MKPRDQGVVRLVPRPPAAGSRKSREQAVTWFREGLDGLADALAEIPSRLADVLAAETDQRGVHDLLKQELLQALEALADNDALGQPAPASHSTSAQNEVKP